MGLPPFFLSLFCSTIRQFCIILKIRAKYAMVYLTGGDENRSNKRAPDSSKRGLYS